MKNPLKYLAIICCLVGLVSCKEKTAITDSPDYITFTVSNMTDSDIGLSGQVNMREYSITIAAGEEYSYCQDALSGAVADDGVPVYSFASVTMEIADNTTLELSSSVFQSMWEEDGDHHLKLTLDQTFLDQYIK